MWHYQIIKYSDRVELVEAIKFEADGLAVEGYTEPLWTAETVEEMVHDFKLILKDIKNYPPVDPEETSV